MIPMLHVRALVSLTEIEKHHFAGAILHLTHSNDKLSEYPFRFGMYWYFFYEGPEATGGNAYYPQSRVSSKNLWMPQKN